MPSRLDQDAFFIHRNGVMAAFDFWQMLMGYGADQKRMYRN